MKERGKGGEGEEFAVKATNKLNILLHHHPHTSTQSRKIIEQVSCNRNHNCNKKSTEKE